MLPCQGCLPEHAEQLLGSSVSLQVMASNVSYTMQELCFLTPIRNRRPASVTWHGLSGTCAGLPEHSAGSAVGP